jgi:microcystin-dependent protein
MVDVNWFMAEIRTFAFNNPPQGWALCNGQTLQIKQNTALYSLLGTSYGGDGINTFCLPNLQGCVPIHAGAGKPGPGLSPYEPGQTGGEQTHTLVDTELATHNHLLGGDQGDASSDDPSKGFYRRGQYPGTPGGPVWAYNVDAVGNSTTELNPATITSTGGGKAHNNMMPSVTVNFCIAVMGIFPSRT